MVRLLNFLRDRFDRIIDAYSDRWRFYHTTEHIRDLISKVKKLSESSVANLGQHDSFSKVFLYLAIFFHDVVYIPTRKDNESNSAIIFDEFLKTANLEGFFFKSDEPLKSTPGRIRQLILMTAKHLSDHGLEHNSLEQIFLDVDMSIVASEWSLYKKYSNEVRQEYIHFSDKDFCQGRSHFLKGLLDVPIFKSDEFGAEFNTQAWDNIKKEIGELESCANSVENQELDL